MSRKPAQGTHRIASVMPDLPSNLETERLNAQRMRTQARMTRKKKVKGVQHLTDEQVRAIRADLKFMTRQCVALKHNVSGQVVSCIDEGTTYAHVKDNP